MKNNSNENKNLFVVKRIYRKIVFHVLLDTFITPVLSFLVICLKPTILIVLKPAFTFITFVSALIMGFIGFMRKSAANEIAVISSDEIVEDSSINFLEKLLDFLF